MMRCARCHRSVAQPVLLGGMPFGAHCAALVRGPRQRKQQAPEPQAPDPRQRELFTEVRP